MKEMFSFEAIWHRYSLRPESSEDARKRKSLEDFFNYMSRHISFDIAKLQENYNIYINLPCSEEKNTRHTCFKTINEASI